MPFDKAGMWIGKLLRLTCPQCGSSLDLKHNGELDGYNALTPSKRKTRTKVIWTNYRHLLDQTTPGQSFTVPKNRLMHFGSQASAWLRGHPSVRLSEEKLEDGGVKITREA